MFLFRPKSWVYFQRCWVQHSGESNPLTTTFTIFAAPFLWSVQFIFVMMKTKQKVEFRPVKRYSLTRNSLAHKQIHQAIEQWISIVTTERKKKNIYLSTSIRFLDSRYSVWLLLLLSSPVIVFVEPQRHSFYC